MVPNGGSGYTVPMISRKLPPAKGPPALSPAAFPQLEAFFGGYLQEDFLVDYGSPEGALRAWRLGASAKENQQFDREAQVLLERGVEAALRDDRRVRPQGPRQCLAAVRRGPAPETVRAPPRRTTR